MAQDQKYFNATLRFGETYVVGGKRFVRDTPLPVDQELKEYLEDTAVERLVQSRGQGRETSVANNQKFEFVEIDAAAYQKATGAEVAAAKKTRARSRS